MRGRRWLFGVCALLAGCNLLSGATDLVTGVDPGVIGDVDAGFDGSLAPDGDISSVGPDGSRDAMTTNDQGPLLDAALDQDASLPDGGRYVFVTAAQTSGDLGGVVGADKTCTMFAASAGLGGVWMAWVTTAASPASSRLTSVGPWYLVTGERVAATKSTLMGATTLDRPIDRDAHGVQQINSPVWTGLPIGGSAGGDCSNWTSTFVATNGGTGDTQYASFAWQQSGSAACSTAHRLYCFEN
jgi:hypothetical protein